MSEKIEDRKAWEELFSILAGSKASLVQTKERDLVARQADGSLRVGLEKDAEKTVALHEAGHVLFSPFDWVEKLGIAAPHPHMKLIANCIEDARIDRRAEEHFGREILSEGREELRSRIAETAPSAVRAVLTRAYQVPIEYSPDEKALIGVFGDDIDQAVASDETLASVRLALRIAYYLKLRDERERERERKREREKAERERSKTDRAESKAPSSPEPKPEEKAKEEPRSERDASSAEEEHTEEEAESHDDDPDEEVESDDGEEEAAEEGAEEEAEEEATKRADTLLQKALKALAPTLAKEARKVERAGEGGRKERLSPGGTDDHRYSILEAKMEPLELSERVRLLLGEVEGEGSKGFRTRGIPTPRVWKLGFGDRRVYTRPPKTKGRTLIALVDLSGSMGCWCPEHRAHNGYLAFQSVAALQEAVPEIRVYGFCSTVERSYIVPLPRGMRPVCRRLSTIPAGNPDCVALEFLRELLVNGVEDTTAVIISDGLPGGPAPLGNEHLEAHTKTLAKEMAAAGLRFASILIGGTGAGVYPSSVIARVNEPDDIAGLGEMLAWLKREEE